MKKILSFVMALAMVTSLVATPKVALLNKSAKKTRTELTLPAVQKQQPQVKHVAKKHVVRKAVSRKAAMASSELYKVDFTASQGGWTIQDKELSDLTYVWKQTDEYGMKASAYNKQAYAAESWLISPAIDLTSATEATLKLNQAVNKGEATNLKVKVSADNGVNWSDLSINMPAGTSWDYQEDEADLADYVGYSIKLAFAYVSTTSICPTWQIKDLVITGDGGTPVPPTPTGDVTITGLNYADAIFYADETYGDYWSFDFYKELDEEGYILSPYVYFICEESATSGTKIAGTWTAYDAGYFATDDEESGIYTDEEVPVGSLTVTCVSQGVYNFVGSFVGTDGKTYTWTLNNMEVYAYNGDTYEDITLTDGGEPTPVGDTIPLTTIDGLEFGYYGSYSEEGAYNYTLTVYNSQSEEYVPQASFDIYTEQLNVFPGIYSAEAGNLGLDYSAYFPTADSEGEYLSAATIEITDGEDGMIHVTGVFITEAGQAYSIDLTAAPYVYDADYPYEPEDPIVLNLTAVSMEEDAEYGSEGMIYAYLYMEDESYVSLTYRALSAIQHLQDGTYPIADLEEESSYLTGYDFYGWPAGSYYEDVNGNVYYFVSGTVTVESLDGATTITINATSAHGSSITVTYSGETPQPSGDHTIVIADYADVSFTTLDGAYTVASAQNGGSSAPVYNADGKDARLYAKNTFTLTSNNGAMTEIVFNISDKGLTRQADIAVSAGEITSYDMTNAKVTWVGNATEVVFTVGDNNTHGTDAPSKAGQFDFTSIDIVNPATGLFDVNVNANVNKFMYNGHLYIRKGGKTYNAVGMAL